MKTCMSQIDVNCFKGKTRNRLKGTIGKVVNNGRSVVDQFLVNFDQTLASVISFVCYININSRGDQLA